VQSARGISKLPILRFDGFDEIDGMGQKHAKFLPKMAVAYATFQYSDFTHWPSSFTHATVIAGISCRLSFLQCMAP
jgi:hypothetical protein